MKHALIISAAFAFLAAVPASAECYADYKAKRDDPLKLHYGVASVSGPCTAQAARAELEPRLASRGWVLLTVLSLFDETGLEERKESAGQFFLRF